jgi:hypothetical protein
MTASRRGKGAVEDGQFFLSCLARGVAVHVTRHRRTSLPGTARKTSVRGLIGFFSFGRDPTWRCTVRLRAATRRKWIRC